MCFKSLTATDWAAWVQAIGVFLAIYYSAKIGRDAFLPAWGDIAEIQIKQIVCRHGEESCVDDTSFTFLHFIHSTLHVVVDTAFSDAA